MPTLSPPKAPLLVAAESFPELRLSLARRFAHDGDSETALAALERADAVAHTHRLASEHAERAETSLGLLPNSATRDALHVLCHKVATGTPLK